MRRLPVPSISLDQLFSKCIEGVSDAATYEKYTDNIGDCHEIEGAYQANALLEELFTLPRTDAGRGEDPLIWRDLTRAELIKLYTQYLVPKEKPARSEYDRLKVTANGKCPFCGDMGHVYTLDHYLPKTYFPLYAVLPGNLIPCCRDCNTIKSASFPSEKGLQTLHPYFDKEKYFTEKWIHARVIQGETPFLEFFVSAPEDWTLDERQRVSSHFRDYELARRFSIEASSDLSETISMRATMLSFFEPFEFAAYLAERSESAPRPINNWRRVTYSTLAADEWFCARAFGRPL